MERKLYLISNYTSEKICLNDDNTCLVDGVTISTDDTIENFRKKVYPFEVLRVQILIGVWNEKLDNGKGGYTYEFGKRLDIKFDYKTYRKELSYLDDRHKNLKKIASEKLFELVIKYPNIPTSRVGGKFKNIVNKRIIDGLNLDTIIKYIETIEKYIG